MSLPLWNLRLIYRLFRCLWLVWLAIGSLMVLPVQAQDQTGGPATIQLTEIDTTRFPEIGLQIYGENLPADLASLSLKVEEDGAEMATSSDATQQGVAGTQTALVLDASGSVSKPGPTGDPVYLEVGKAVRRLVSLGVLSADRDWLTAITFDPSVKPMRPLLLQDWKQDHQGVVDSLYVYKPNPEGGNTSIDGLLDFTLRRFQEQTLPKGQVRSIVLFSDGIDVLPLQGLFEAVQLAQASNIHIHTVLIGADNNEGARTKLTDLATQTGGKFFTLSSVEAGDTIWQAVAEGGTRRLVTYRTQQSKPGNVRVSLTLPDGKVLQADKEVVLAAPLQAPIVTLTSPAAGTTIIRNGPKYDTPLTELDPATMELQVTYSFADGLVRNVRSIEYEVAGRAETLSANFDQPYSFNISTLDAGEYTVRARVIDEVGMEGVSDPVPFRVVLKLPPTPTFTPDPALAATATAAAITATQVAIAQITADAQATVSAQATATVIAAERAKASTTVNTLTITNIVTAVLGLAALGYAIYLLSNRDRRKAVTEAITGTVAAATQPFLGGRRGGKRAQPEQPRAQLRLLDDGGIANVKQTIPLNRTSIRIGRDPAVVDVVLADRHVSKLHCRIVEDASTAGYRLLDEGSTSGTQVNDEDVNINGQSLRNGDVISIGPIQYQFEMIGQPPARGRSQQDTQESTLFDQDDNTQVYIRSKDVKSGTEPYRGDQ